MNVILGKAPEPFHCCKLLSVNTKLKFINIKILFRRLQEVAEAFFLIYAKKLKYVKI